MKTKRFGNIRKKMKIAAVLLAVLLTLPYPYAFAEDPVTVAQPPSQVVQPIQIIPPVSIFQPASSIPKVTPVSLVFGPGFFTSSPLSIVPTSVVTTPVAANIATSNVNAVSAPATSSASVNVATTPTVSAVSSVNPASTATTPTVSAVSLVNPASTATTLAPGLQTNQEFDPTQPVTGKFLGAMKTVALRIGSKILTISQAFYVAVRDAATKALKVTQLFLQKFLTKLARLANLKPVDTNSSTRVGKLGTRPVLDTTTEEKQMLIAQGLASDSDDVFKYQATETRTPIGTSGKIELISSLTMYHKSSNPLKRNKTTVTAGSVNQPIQTSSSTPVTTTSSSGIASVPAQTVTSGTSPISVAASTTNGGVPVAGTVGSSPTASAVAEIPSVVTTPSTPTATAGPANQPIQTSSTSVTTTSSSGISSVSLPAQTVTFGTSPISVVASTKNVGVSVVGTVESSPTASAVAEIPSVVMTPSTTISSVDSGTSLAPVASIVPTSLPIVTASSPTILPVETTSSSTPFVPFVPVTLFTPIVPIQNITPVTEVATLPAVDLSNAVSLPSGG